MSAVDGLHRYTAFDGVALAYRRWPPVAATGAPPVVLLHGAASNSTRWWHFVATTQLRESRLLLAPDLRGHAASMWRGPATSERWCDDLAALLDHEGVERAFVAGHCMGANLALHFAARHPRRCAGLILIEPMARIALVGALARLARIRWLLSGIVAVVGALNRLGLYRRRLLPLDLEALDRTVRDAAEPEQGLALMRGRYASPWHDWQTLPTVQYLGDLLETLRPLPVEDVRCPALAMVSAGRLMAAPDRTREALAGLQEIAFVELEADHWIPTEQPDEMRRLIDAWVAERSRR